MGFEKKRYFSYSVLIVIIVSGFVAPQIASAVKGGIGDTIIESLEFDPDNGNEVNIIAVDADTFAIAYQGPDSDGFLKTVNIDATGDISAVIDTLEFDGTFADDVRLIKVDADTFAIVYRNTDTNGVLATVDITATGDIAAAVTETLTFDASTNFFDPYIIAVDADTFAIAYQSAGDDGFLTTVDITSTGDIAAAVTETLEFDPVFTNLPIIVPVDADTFAITYQGPSDDGFLITVDITSTGDIAAAVTETLEFDTDFTDDSFIVAVDADTFAIAYQGTAGDGFVKTIDITATGDIADSVTSTLEFDTDNGDNPIIVAAGGNTFAIAYQGTDGDGFVKTLEIDDNGSISSIIDTLEFDTDIADQPWMVKIDADTFAIVYQGTDGDGFLVTIFIDTGIKPANGPARPGDVYPPTLGVNQNSKRVVDFGFSYNNNPTQVEYSYTPYPLITVNVGQQNIAELIIYEDRGTRHLSHVALAFGLKQGQALGDSKAVIIWDRNFGGDETVSTTDPENAIDSESLKIQSSKAKCLVSSQNEFCTKLAIFHKFRAPLDFDIVGITVWDDKRNSWQFTFNHGIHVQGESLNPPVQHVVMDKRDLITITEIGKNVAVDEDGNIWEYNKSWQKQLIPKGKIDDGVTMHLYDRDHVRFPGYMQEQELIAKQTLIEKYPEYVLDVPFEEIGNIFSYEIPETDERTDNAWFESKIANEIIKAEQTYHVLYDIHDRMDDKN